MGHCLITRRGGGADINPNLPMLDGAYPQDLVIWGGEEDAVFKVVISSPGADTNYTYQWYKDGVVAGTSSTYSETAPTDYGTHTLQCVITTSDGAVASRIATLTVKNPNFLYTYDGNSHQNSEGSILYCDSSGKLTITNFGKNESGLFDIFMLGGGGGGAITGLGGGGYYSLTSQKQLEKNTTYQITIGAGGAGGTTQTNGGAGGFTSATIPGLTNVSGGSGGTRVDGTISCKCVNPNGSAGNVYSYRYSYNMDTGAYTLSQRTSIGDGYHTVDLVYPLTLVAATYNGGPINVYLAPNKYAYYANVSVAGEPTSGGATAGAGGEMTRLFNDATLELVSGPGVFSTDTSSQRYGQGGNNKTVNGRGGLVALRFSS